MADRIDVVDFLAALRHMPPADQRDYIDSVCHGETILTRNGQDLPKPSWPQIVLARCPIPPPPPPPPPPSDPPPECVSAHVIRDDPASYPWYPGHAEYCGAWNGINYFRPKPDTGNGNGDDDTKYGGREKQPHGDVTEDEDPDIFPTEDQDDYEPFDPE